MGKYEALIYDEIGSFTFSNFTDMNVLIWYVIDYFNTEYSEPPTRVSVNDYGEGDKIIHSYWRSGKKMTAVVLCTKFA